MSVHYTLLDYYIPQCLAEMYVLKTDTLIYLSFSEESTTFLKVSCDNELWTTIWNEAKSIYDLPDISEPKRTRNLKHIKLRLKAFVTNNVEFLCDLSACVMFGSCLRTATKSDLFMLPVEKENCVLYRDELGQVIQKAKHVVRSSYELTRRRATELMVWVLINKDRNTKTEIPCSLPLAYGLKYYRLTTQAMRNATEAVLKSCSEHGLSSVTDGQWVNLMNREASGKLLTLLQFRKDVCDELRSFSKLELISKISELGRTMDDYSGVFCLIIQDGTITLSSKNGAVSSIRTPLDTSVWTSSKKSNDSHLADSEPDIHNEVDNCWLPTPIVTELSNTNDSSVQETMLTIAREVSYEPIETSHVLESQLETDLSSLFSGDDRDYVDETVSTTGLEGCGLPKVSDNNTDVVQDDEGFEKADYSNENVQDNTKTQILQLDDTLDMEMNTSNQADRSSTNLSDNLLSEILMRLQADGNSERKDINTSKLKESLTDRVSIDKLRHIDLNIIISALSEQEELQKPAFWKSMKKQEKIVSLHHIELWYCK